MTQDIEKAVSVKPCGTAFLYDAGPCKYVDDMMCGPRREQSVAAAGR